MFSIQVLGESTESRVEENFKLIDPGHHFLQSLWLKTTNSVPPIPPLGHQIGFLENFEMLRNGSKRNSERFSQLVRRFFFVF
ncbi:MAG TPA: hypothetical protein VN857_19235 [Chthoniobacterales bacterium]|jgi:hypothetical protein|nr:hypothetical protein [Chthoniobacterales bacterium]